MDPRLIIMSVGYFFGITLTIGLSLFVFLRAKRSKLSLLFQLMNFSILIVEISIAMMAFVDAPALLSLANHLNMMNIFLVVFMAHWALEVIDKARALRMPLLFTYLAGIALFLYYVFSPESFLLPPEPKLYLPHYFEPGFWYSVMRAYFAAVTVYVLYELFKAYRESTDTTLRNRLKYVFSGIAFGMATGQMALFLVYDIPVDPLFSTLFPLYTLPFAYAVIRYELMDIKVVAKLALIYALTVSALAFVLGFVGLLNDSLIEVYPGMPRSIVPLFVSLIASSLGFLVWMRLRENETLKYEFITVVTHKFRTPLTEIKWAVESLLPKAATREVADGLTAIAHADTALVELTNMLIETTDAESATRPYTFAPVSLSDLVSDALKRFQNRIAAKRLRVRFDAPAHVFTARADRARLSVVIETLIENAVFYTPEAGAVDISLTTDGKDIALTVADNGIGIAHADLPRIFEKFYRSDAAKHVMTEGMGIGLYMAKRIAERHGGTLHAASEGIGKGAQFTLRLPAL